MIEQDGFKTTYDSHNQTSSEPTELDKFKEEIDAVSSLVNSMVDRVRTDEFKQCFGDWMKDEDFKEIYNDVFRLHNRVFAVRFNIDWYEEGKKK